MNLSHIINEFSFGPYFPDITQPLDYSYEVAPERTSLDLISSTPPLIPFFFLPNSIHELPILPHHSPDLLLRPTLRAVTHELVQRPALHTRTRA